jgi:2-dehydro-3-deoxyphosphooctonate aldolase (KDO 8-P synthase)
MDLSLVPNLKNLDANNFFLLAGPCAIEGEDMALRIAEKVVRITDDLKIPYVFKGSFRKANRSRIDSFTGIGDEKALKILRKVSETFQIPTVTDIHEVSDAEKAAEYVDISNSCVFSASNRFGGCCSKNRKGGEFKERTIYEPWRYEARG